jgi:hypothetical protein
VGKEDLQSVVLLGILPLGGIVKSRPAPWRHDKGPSIVSLAIKERDVQGGTNGAWRRPRASDHVGDWSESVVRDDNLDTYSEGLAKSGTT